MDNCWHIIAINVNDGENCSIGIIDISRIQNVCHCLLKNGSMKEV